MKFIILTLLVSSFSAYASSQCITQVSQKDPHVATRTAHSLKKAECSCPCTAHRNDNNQCTECGHKVAAHHTFKIKN